LTAIIEELERRAETREIGRLQEIRQELKGHARAAGHAIFTPLSMFEQGRGRSLSYPYAFHHGGRTELQFNVGFEPGGFRNGVAFSFEPSRTVPRPEETLIPSVKRFNEYLTLHPQQFADMSMWHWEGNERKGSDHPPTPIQAGLIRRGLFLFMGRMQPANAIDYDLIVEDFDRLLPLYRFVEGNEIFPEVTEQPKTGFQFKPGCTVKLARTTGSLQERELNITLRHNELQRALHNHLASVYSTDDVGTERESAGGQVDVVVRRGDTFWFYEIKTAMSARACIRQALSQLLEYSFWPGGQEAEKLVIVGEAPLDRGAELYLTILRKRFALPIEYAQFDMATGRLNPSRDLLSATAP
jgi:hypothetical protein